MPIEHQYSRVIHHHGRTYFATTTMSDIFLAHARDILERGDTELVPLLHKGGVELLLVGPLTRFAVADIEVGAVGTGASVPSPVRVPPPADIAAGTPSHRVAG